jgi:hypothetical protein
VVARALSAVRWATPWSQLATSSGEAIDAALADEDEEGGLERVLGIVVIAQDPAAHAPHHRTMLIYNCRNCGLFTPADVVREQLPIGQPRPIAQKHCPAEVLDDLVPLAGRHVVSLVRLPRALYLTTARAGPFDAFFCWQPRSSTHHSRSRPTISFSSAGLRSETTQ